MTHVIDPDLAVLVCLLCAVASLLLAVGSQAPPPRRPPGGRERRSRCQRDLRTRRVVR